MKLFKQKIYRKFGNFFKKLMRYCYTKHKGICWCCGADCGFQSHITKQLFWCNYCYKKWDEVINSDLHISWRGIGVSKNKKD